MELFEGDPLAIIGICSFSVCNLEETLDQDLQV